MNLFSRLLRLHKRTEQGIETSNPNGCLPEEDFFTEIIGHISETEPAILFDWLNDYAFAEPRQFTSVRVTTQKRFNPPTGFNIESKLDLVMELDCSRRAFSLESSSVAQGGRSKFGRTTITNVVFAVAIRRRWRTVPRYRASDGIRIPRQIARSLPSDLSRLAARDAAIRARK